jgi:hypothetical protein
MWKMPPIKITEFLLLFGVLVVAALAMVKMNAHNPGGVIVPLHFMIMWVKSGEDWLLVGRHTAKLPN